MLEEQLTAKAVDCEEYARQVAADHHLAAEFAQLSSVNDTVGAQQVVADAAADILGYCVQAYRPKDRNLSLLLSVRAVEEVAERSQEQGDEIQCAWCALLHHRLLGDERLST
jgi:hypothetical protein